MVLLEEAHWLVEHNHCTCNRSLSTWFYHDVGCWRACVLPGLALRSKHIQYAHHPARWNSFGLILRADLQIHTDLRLPRPTPKVADRLLWLVFKYILSNVRKEMAATRSQRSVSHVSCVRDKLMMSTRNPYFIYIHIYIYTHPHMTCSHTHVLQAREHRQWHKPSVVVFRLHRAVLMQCVPYNGACFHFHPRTAAPPFCSSHLHRSLCTHNM